MTAYHKGQIVWLGKGREQPGKVTRVTTKLIKVEYIDNGGIVRHTWIPKGQEQYETLPIYENGIRNGKWA